MFMFVHVFFSCSPPCPPQALLSELAEHSGKVEELKGTLRKLIAENPDSPEADGWRQQLQEIGGCS